MWVWILAQVHWGILGGKGEGKVPSQGNTFLVIADIIKRSVLTARPRERRQCGYVTFSASAERNTSMSENLKVNSELKGLLLLTLEQNCKTCRIQPWAGLGKLGVCVSIKYCLLTAEIND